MPAAKTHEPISLYAIATTLGEIKAKQEMMLAQLGHAATREQFQTVKDDVDGLGRLIRENHSNLDSRVRTLESDMASVGTDQKHHRGQLERIVDWVFKAAAVLAMIGLGVKAV